MTRAPPCKGYSMSIENIRVLVADDHTITRNLVRSIVRSIGISSITLAENGREAANAILADEVDLAICDWNMPLLTGLEVLQLIRAEPRHKKLPFLMLTAEAYADSVVAAVQSGVSEYVVKPFTADILIAKVKGLVGEINDRYQLPDL